MKKIIEKDLKESIAITNYALLHQLSIIEQIARLFIECLKKGGKIILFGNGGSAADAQHIAAELIGRFEKDRLALRALSLTTNTSILTAVANDFGFSEVFSKQIEGLANPGDVAVGISTSGSSKNVIEALKKARQLGLVTIGFSGASAGEMSAACDVTLTVESNRTCRIQEIHIKIGHIICGLVEAAINSEK